MKPLEILYEDNHIIVVCKAAGDIVQGDSSGDKPLSEHVKDYIKAKYKKPGSVFLGVVHRLDRPVMGIVIFARTSKALTRLNDMLRNHQIQKTYWAIVPLKEGVEKQATLHHWITRNSEKNLSRAHLRSVEGAKEAVLDYRCLSSSDRYMLLEIDLHTGRHHQIRCQLAKAGIPIKGDLKYGSPRSNPDKGISLLARRVRFVHPVTKKMTEITAPLPDDRLWKTLASGIDDSHT